MSSAADARGLLGAGGTWQWGDVAIAWTFEPESGWETADVANVIVVPFVGDEVVIIRTDTGLHGVGGTLEPDEHWCVAATRELWEEAGARLVLESPDLPLLHPFGVFRCHTNLPRPYRPHLPWPDYSRVCCWAEVTLTDPPTESPGREQVLDVLTLDLETACGLIDPSMAEVYRLAARLRAQGVHDETWCRDNVRLLEEHYLRSPTAQGQSGSSRDAAGWAAGRRVVVDAIHHDGTFLDLGCANGLLMESVQRWAAEEGKSVEPYGMDMSERLLELARSRLPQWRDRFWWGNALRWSPPRRFDYVHTMNDLVPGRRRAEWLQKVLHEMVAPGGRLVVRGYEGVAERLRGYGIAPSGVSVRHRSDGPPVEAAWVDA